MKMPHLRGFVSPRRNGFSLVEVTIALGLISFALISILGLIPTGLSTLRQSMNQTVEAQIVRTIGAQAVLTSYTNLAMSGAYFDDEGLPVAAASGACYIVNVTKANSVFPGSTNANALASSLTALNIQIVAKPNPAAAGKTNLYTLLVANSGN